MRSGAKTSSGAREQKVSVSCPSDSPMLDCIKLNSTSPCRQVGERSLPTACRRALWCAPSSSSHLKWIGSTFLPACQHKDRQTRSKNMRCSLFASWFIHLLSPALQHWYGNQRYNKQRLNYTLYVFSSFASNADQTITSVSRRGFNYIWGYFFSFPHLLSSLSLNLNFCCFSALCWVRTCGSNLSRNLGHACSG